MMTKLLYEYYLKTDHWQTVRETFLHGVKQCSGCGITRSRAKKMYGQDLNVHHLSYDNLYAELWSDLQALCRRCHQFEHFGWSDLRYGGQPQPQRTPISAARNLTPCWPTTEVSVMDPHQAVRSLIGFFSFRQLCEALKGCAL